MSSSRDHQPRSDDAAAYVLGALEPDEASEFRAHAERCDLCGAELERLAAAAALLPLAVAPVAPPRSLKRHVLQTAAGDAKAARRRSPARAGWSRPFLTRAGLAGSAVLAAGVALIVLLALPGGTTTRTTRATVANAAAWHWSTVPVALLERTGEHGQLVIRDLPQTPSGKVYELWIERHDVPLPTDVLFEPTSSGDAAVDVPGSLAGAQAVMVTAEPQGGSKVPSTVPLIEAQLTS